MKMTLKMARVGAHLTQAEMAYKLGVSQPTYSKYEKEPDTMRLKDVVKFCEICNVQLNDIFLI